jgi:acyl-CoA thioesterase
MGASLRRRTRFLSWAREGAFSAAKLARMNQAETAQSDALAERAGSAMYARDRASRSLGIELLEIHAGFARVAFTVRDDMLNGLDVCHGGILFTLADAAFSYACNSRNDTTLALQCSISFSAPARLGERVEAVARERSLGGRTGTYDVEVSGPSGALAHFRGVSYRVNAKVIAES